MKNFVRPALVALVLTVIGAGAAAASAAPVDPAAPVVSLQACRTNVVDSFGQAVVQVRMYLRTKGYGLDIYTPGSAVQIIAPGTTVATVDRGRTAVGDRTITIDVTFHSPSGDTYETHRLLYVSRGFCKAYGPFQGSYWVR